MKAPTQNDPQTRRPAAFTLETEETARPSATQKRAPRSFDAEISLTPDEDDPFLVPEDIDAAALPVAIPKKSRFSFGKLALGALGVLFSLAFGLWADQLIRNLFSRSDWLGYTATIALIVALFAVLALVGREVFGIMRLNAVQSLKADAETASLDKSPKPARAIVTRPALLLADEPTGNLDTKTSVEIMELITSLNRDKGITVVMVTHEEDIAAYAGRLLRFVDGHLASDSAADHKETLDVL